jgi:nucleotide-binding universal stress UspA family protein
MFRRILVATDFSACSQQAFERALEIASAAGGTVDLVHVFRTPDVIPPEVMVRGGRGDQSLTTLYREHAQEEMDALLRTVEKYGAHVGSARLEDGDPARRILERAETGKYDLVVVGTHGRTGLEHALLGSVAEKVVRLCPVPVLSVRKPEQA